MQSKEAFNWNDLRYFLELSRVKKLVLAGPRLGVESTTVKRRIAVLESQIGSKLFVLSKAGYELTDVGRALLKSAEKIEAIAQVVQEDLAGQDYQISGSVRVGSTEGLGTCFLAKYIWTLQNTVPGLQIDLIAVPRFVNLSDREADIAIAIERPIEGHYVVSKLTDYSLRLYASRSYLESSKLIDTATDLASHPFVGYIDDLVYSKELRYLDEILGSGHQFSMRSSSVIAQIEAVREGAGIAILPSFMAANDPALVPVLEGKVEFVRTFWLVTREDNFHLSRIKAVWNFVKKIVDQHQDIFMPSFENRNPGKTFLPWSQVASK